jgi:hypothetical protein
MQSPLSSIGSSAYCGQRTTEKIIRNVRIARSGNARELRARHPVIPGILVCLLISQFVDLVKHIWIIGRKDFITHLHPDHALSMRQIRCRYRLCPSEAQNQKSLIRLINCPRNLIVLHLFYPSQQTVNYGLPR